MACPATLPEAFQQTASAHPDAVALRTPGGAVSITWGEYANAVRRVAGGSRRSVSNVATPSPQC